MKKLKRVTWLPGFILKLKGRIDAKSGAEVCDQYIKKLQKKSASIESSAVIYVEKDLLEQRKRAAVIISKVKEDNDDVVDAEVENSKKKIRAQRRKQAREEQKKNALNELLVINETINSKETELDEQINKHRNKTESKIKAYVMGVKKKIKEYEKPEFEDDSARDIYYNRHVALDSLIKGTIEKIGFKEVEYETI